MTKTIEINIETGEEILRDLTSEEVLALEKMKTEQEAKDALEIQKAIEKANLLTKLNLTEAEAKLLLS